MLIRDRAISYTDSDKLTWLRPSMHTAIGGAFVWSKTPEGRKYWLEVRNKYKDFGLETGIVSEKSESDTMDLIEVLDSIKLSYKITKLK